MKAFLLPFIILSLSCVLPAFAQTPSANPDLSPGCPMNIIFVMDESGSIAGSGSGTTNVSGQVRTGAIGLLNTLVGTGSRVAIVEFNSTARRASVNNTTAYQEVNAATINGFIDYVNDSAGNTTPNSRHYDPEDYLSVNNTFTNWQDALVLTKSINTTEGLAQLVVFFTDGIPTAYNKSTGGVTTGTTTAIITNALNKAILGANDVKAQGSHIFVVAFPNPSLTESYVQAISGTDRYPDLQPDFTLGDYTSSTSQTLQNDLNRVGVVICHVDIKLAKTANVSVSCTGSNVVFTLTAINEGLLNATGIVVKDYLPSGYTYVSNNGGAAFSAEIIAWNVGSLSYLQTKTLQITATVNPSGVYKNIAEVTACDQTDGDSTPNNGVESEDDQSASNISLLNCNDNIICTIDACANAACTHVQNPNCCATNADCNDNNICTTDACVSSLCARTPIQGCCTSAANCNDNDACTTDNCTGNQCGYTIVNCDDSNLCTSDACNANSGCTHNQISNCCITAVDCNDNSVCTDDACLSNQCSHASINCDDAILCTTDGCNSISGCTHSAINNCCISAADCDDNSICTNDGCSNNLCSHTNIACSDNNTCTTDECSLPDGCFHVAVSCDDANSCTTDDCDQNSGCTHVLSAECCSTDEQCNDNDLCTIDGCISNHCSNTAKDCNDNNVCTTDGCELASGCTHTAIICDDANICTSDICNAINGCTYAPVNCDDGDACTADGCDNGICTHTSSNCNDNNPCTTDGCSLGNCIHTQKNCADSSPCTVDACSNGTCTHTAVVCNDGNLCTNDICAGGTCRFLAKNCNDSNACTTDGCNVATGLCTNNPINCEDGDLCTTDICTNGVCSSSAMNCDDANPNTIDACFTGQCLHTPVSCDNPTPLNILFILDESGSIAGYGNGTTNVSAQVRNGASAMFNSLSGTNSKVAVIEFNTNVRRVTIGGTNSFQQINASTLPAFQDYITDNNATADNNHYDPEDYISTPANTFTNWEGALKMAQTINTTDALAPLIIFFTDGVPTAYMNGNGTVTTGSGPAFEPLALSKAVIAANAVKGQGSHMFVVGIPNTSLPENNVQQISGAKRYPDVEPVFTNADYSISTSQSLQNDLTRIGALICRADLSLKNSVSQPVVCGNSSVVFTLTITNGGLENALGVVVKDYLPNGYTYLTNDGGATISSGTITWNVGTLNNGQTKTLNITVSVNASGNYHNAAEITASYPGDSDSQPGNYNGVSPLEDDEADASVTVNCNCTLKVTSLSMMYEGALGVAGELFDGKIIDQDTLCRWNVRANVCQSVGSIKFLLNGSTFRIENTAPYSLNGDQPTGYFTPWIPNPGNYTLTAVAYSGASASGTIGTAYTVRFTVLAGQSNAACLSPPKIDCAGKVNGTALLDDCGICSGGTSGHVANSNKDRCGICNGNGSTCCITNNECSDNNLCTLDLCITLACTYAPLYVDDGNPCTLDVCNPQTGVFTSTAVTCNDNNTCTTDICDGFTGCHYTLIQGCCHVAADCPDNNVCTTDICSAGQCDYTDINCDDNNTCTIDNCNTQIGCLHPVSAGCCNVAADCNDSNACTDDACSNSQCSYTDANCDDNISCTTDDCDTQAGCQHTGGQGCCVINADCNDNDACTADVCTNTACGHSGVNCDDNISCTTDDCDTQAGCQHVAGQGCCLSNADCNDNDACTTDACASNQCGHPAVNCNDNNNCTTDNCDAQAGCQHTTIQGCCLTAANCNDNDPCTTDLCSSNTCSYTSGAALPSYLKVVNPVAASYRKVTVGYASTGLYGPKLNVSASGNNQLCITLKDVNGTAQWSKIKVKPQSASSPVVYLGTYTPASPGTNVFTVCIPLSAFSPIDFTQLQFIEFQCNNAAAFEIQIQRIAFSGGTTTFNWFGDPKTDNFHNGTTGSTGELIATTVVAPPCGATKLSGGEDGIAEPMNEEVSLNAYPNPFKDDVNISFSVPNTEKVKLEIYSMEGKHIAILFEGEITSNEMQQVDFHAGELSNGMYFYRLTIGSGSMFNKKLLLMR